MSTHYDVAVIGAGLGGLSVATSLAVAGRKVLLIEKRNIPGGYASSFVRGRFEFEVALHALSGIGPPGNRSRLYQYLERLGVAEKIEFVDTGEMYRSVFPTLDISLPTGREAYEEALADAFPRERQGISTFMGRLDDLSYEVDAYNESGGRPNPTKLKNIARYLPVTLAQVLERDVANPLARAVICQTWGYYGLGPSECSFMLYAMALRNYVVNSVWYVKGRSQLLAYAFVERLREAGGEVLFSSGVEKITSSSGRATGVVTEHGDHFTADVVISNTSPITTIDSLIGRENVPAKYTRQLAFREPSTSTFNVYLGLVGEPVDLGLSNYEIFVNDSANLDEHARRMKTLTEPAHVAVTTYSDVYPEISPPGTTMTVLTSLMYGRPWDQLDPADYHDVKERIADSVLSKVESTLCPGIRDAAEVISVSTPLTNARYAGTVSGAIYGSAPYPYDSTVLRTPHSGPLENLYLVGSWTARAGGFEPAMLDGRDLSLEILDKS